MKWPFVRRSKYEQLLIDFKIINDEKDWHLEHNTQLSDENDSYFQEINRLNQDLAKELNRYRETKEQKNELSAECDRLYDEVDNLKNELKETKDALKIAIDDLKNAALCIGEQKTQLEIWKKRSNFYSNNCTEAKESISKVRGILRQIAKKL